MHLADLGFLTGFNTTFIWLQGPLVFYRSFLPVGKQVKLRSPPPGTIRKKTIGIAYNKGNYQIVDKADFKTMGKKT